MRIDPIVADFFEASVDVIREAGGWVLPGTHAIAGDSGLSLSNPAADGGALALVPQSCFLPISEYAWGADEILEIVGPGPDLDPLATELLVLQIAMHNHRDALGRIAREHPQLAVDLDEGLISAVRTLRPSFRRGVPTPASLFWSNRCLRLPSPATQPTGATTPMLVPIIDLLDHRSGVPSGYLHPRGFGADVAHDDHAPLCFLNYGRERDPIGMAVVYGFVDTTNSLAHSATVHVGLPGIGEVVVAARGRDRSGELLDIQATRHGERVVLSRLTFDRRQPLASLTAEVVAATGLPVDSAERLIDRVAHGNLELLARVEETAGIGQPTPAATVLAGAARVQRLTIESVLSA